MVGWRNYLAAGLTTLGLSFMPNDVSTGTGGSNDSLDKNSKLENQVQVEESGKAFAQNGEGFDFDFEKEKLDNGGVAYKAHVLAQDEFENPISSCVCKDIEDNGVYSNAIVYNSAYISITSRELGSLDNEKGISSFFLKEAFDLDVSLTRNDGANIKGINKYGSSFYRMSNFGGLPTIENYSDAGNPIKMESLANFTAWDMDSRKTAIEKIGETGANKARYLASACQELSEGNKRPIKEFLKRESTSTFILPFRKTASGWEEGRVRQNLISDKVWDMMYVPGTAVSEQYD